MCSDGRFVDSGGEGGNHTHSSLKKNRLHAVKPVYARKKNLQKLRSEYYYFFGAHIRFFFFFHHFNFFPRQPDPPATLITSLSQNRYTYICNLLAPFLTPLNHFLLLVIYFLILLLFFVDSSLLQAHFVRLSASWLGWRYILGGIYRQILLRYLYTYIEKSNHREGVFARISITINQLFSARREHLTDGRRVGKHQPEYGTYTGKLNYRNSWLTNEYSSPRRANGLWDSEGEKNRI